MKNIFLIFSLFCFVNSINAQLSRITYEEVSVKDAKTIKINLYGEYELIPWVGNMILIESQIELYTGSEAVLEHFIKEGRYKVETTRNNDQLLITSKDMERKPIRTKSGECSEYVSIKIFIPDDFNNASANLLSREISTTQSANNPERQ